MLMGLASPGTWDARKRADKDGMLRASCERHQAEPKNTLPEHLWAEGQARGGTAWVTGYKVCQTCSQMAGLYILAEAGAVR